MITFRNLGNLGRFGNQLFQYSGTRLYAELNGFSWSFPDWSGDHIFRLLHKPLGLKDYFLPTIQLADMASTGWSERLLSPLGLWRRSSIEELYKKPKDNISLYGYLQDPVSIQLLKAQKAKVREWLSFAPEIENAFRDATRHLKPWVGLHVRQGDLIKRSRTVPLADYQTILENVRNNRPVIIASDNPTIATEFSQHDPIVLKNPLPSLPPEYFDFWLLTRAETVIGGGSTFSWWAAYLGNNNDYWSPRLTHQWTPDYVPVFEKVAL